MDNLIAYSPSLAQGTLVTISVGLASLALSVGLGLLGAWGKLAPNRLANWSAAVYTTVIRGVPELVLMLLLFFGGQILINDLADSLGWDYIDIDPFTAGTLTIGFIYGAYMTETFRGAFLAIPRGEIEAGAAFGMSRGVLFLRILVPQLIRYAVPGFGNNWLVLVKATALCSVIGLDDLVRKADIAAKSVREPFTFFLGVMIVFLAITTVYIWALRWLETRYTVGVRRA